MTPVLDIALSIAANGLPVFPCGPTKRPCIPKDKGGRGFHDAVVDQPAVQELFAKTKAALVGVPTGERSGFDVLDFDYKNGAKAWEEENSHRLPPTRAHQTQSGGRHLLFKHAPGVRNLEGNFAPGMDVRGEGGYVIMPPSPGYSVVDDSDIAEWPDWLLAIMLDSRPKPAPRSDAPYQSIELTSKRLNRFKESVLSRVRGAGEGQKHYALRNAALSLGGIQQAAGLSDGEIANMLLDALPSTAKDLKAARATIEWGLERGRQQPIDLPDREEYRRNGYMNGHSEEPPPYEPPLHEPYSERDQTEGHRDISAGTNVPLHDNSLFPLVLFNEITPSLDARDFLQGVLEEQAGSVVYGESNAGKTFWATDAALHIAAGIPWNGRRVERGGVVYCVLEGGRGFRNRVAAWRDSFAEDRPVAFAAIQSGLNLLNPDADTSKLISSIREASKVLEIPVKLIVIDTLSRALAGGNENAPEDMGALVINMDRIRSETGAHVMFIHHSGKDAAKGARGHSLLRAAIDTEIEVAAEEGTERKTATVVKQRELKKGDVFEFALNVISLGTNRHGEDVTTCLVASSNNPNATPAQRKASGMNGRALEILTNLIASSGQSGFRGTPLNALSVPEAWWRERFYEQAQPGAEDEAKKKAFRRAADHLVETHVVGMADRRVWLVQKRPVNAMTEPGTNVPQEGH